MTTLFVILALLGAAGRSGPAEDPAAVLLRRMVEMDSFALNGAEQSSHAIVRRGGSVTGRLQFSISSRKSGPGLAEVLIRFSKPVDIAGGGILLLQHRAGDDERFLFLPELKKTRRIPGSERDQTFMGMDFTFADLDRRDLREGHATLLAAGPVGDVDCNHIDIDIRNGPYSHTEVWISKETSLPLKWRFYDHAGKLLKTLDAEETRRVNEHWYITRSRMVNVQTGHSTEMILDRVVPTDDAPADHFSVRELERL